MPDWEIININIEPTESFEIISYTPFTEPEWGKVINK